MADLGESEGSLNNKKGYQKMVEEQESKYLFGQQSKKLPFKLNQPFVLYNCNKKSIKYKDITYIDSKEIFDFKNSSYSEAIRFYFEKEGSKSRDSQYISPQTEYKLFTYFNNVKYYLDATNEFLLDLRSTKSKNTIKVNVVDKVEKVNPNAIDEEKRYILRAAPNYYFKRQLCFKKIFEELNDFDLSDRNVEIGTSDSTESIGLENMMKVTFFKHQSKISLQFCYDEKWRSIYFCNDDQTLKIIDNEFKKYYFDIEFESESNELLETTQFKIRVNESPKQYLKICKDEEGKANLIFQARFDQKLSNAYDQLLHQYIQEILNSNSIDQFTDKLANEIIDSYSYKSEIVNTKQLNDFSYFMVTTLAINYYSDESLNKYINMFGNHDSKFWYENKNLMLFHQSMIEKHLKLKVIPTFDFLIDMNIDVHQFVKDIDWSKENYDRQIVEGLILHTFRYAKNITCSQMYNSNLSKLILESLSKSNAKYFEPIDLESCFQVYFKKYSHLPRQFPEYKENYEEDEEEDKLTKDYSGCGIKVTVKDKYCYTESFSKSTFVREFICDWFDNKINLLGENSKRMFVVGDMFVDAAMWYSQKQAILEKIKHKYSIDSLIKALTFSKECFHFLEGVICLLRSCYLNKSTLSTESQDKIDDIKKGIFDNLKLINDIKNIEQLGFATQAIMLATSLYGRLNNEDKDELNAIVLNLFIKLLENYIVYAIPNAFDFNKDTAFLDQKLIEQNRQLVDNEFKFRDVVLETHQKNLVFAICKLIKISNLNQLSIIKTQYKSELLKSLNLESHMLEKCITLFILKYVDIPFEEEFTDELVNMLLLLQFGQDSNESDSEFERLSKTIQNVIVSIHNYNVNGKIHDLRYINYLVNQLKDLRNRLEINHKKGTFNNKDIYLNQFLDYRITLILGELLYKVRCNSSLNELRQSKNINLMLIKIYKTLGYLMENDQDICVKLWHFSQKMFCIKWWNQILNRYHAEFFFGCVTRLKVNKTTQFTIDLFSKVCQNIGEVILEELSKENKNNSLKNLFNLFKDIGDKYGNKMMFNNPKTKSIFNFLTTADINLEIDLFCNHIMINKYKELDGGREQDKVKGNENYNHIKEESKTKEFNSTQNKLLSSIKIQKQNDDSSKNDNQSLKQKFGDKIFNDFCLVLKECKVVDIFEELLKSIPKEISKKENKRFDSKISFICNFIHKSIKYVTERDQDYQNRWQYQYLMNMLLLIVKSDVLMRDQDIKRMFNSDIAINSWFLIISKDCDFCFFDKHMKCMVYQILTQILKVDTDFTRQKIMQWTYNIDKTEKLINRIVYSIQYFTDSIITNKNNFNLSDHETDRLSDYHEIHYCIKFLNILCDSCQEFQDYLRVQHNIIRSSNVVSSIVTLIRVCLSSVKYKFALKMCTQAFKAAYALNNQMNQENKDFFMSIRTYEFVKQIMELGWFSKDNYYSIIGEEESILNASVFNSNKMILKLKLMALEVSHQIIDNENRHEFLNSIGKEILNTNLKIGYAQLLHLYNGVMHSKFFDKNDKICDNFNILMLFSCYYLRVKISDKEIKEK